MKSHFQYGRFFYQSPKLWHMNDPTLCGNQGSKEHAYKEDQAIWFALSNYLFSPSEYNHTVLAFAPQLMGWKKLSFFKFCQSLRPYEDVLTNGININKSMLFRYFDTLFIYIQIENCKLFTCWWRNTKDFIGPATIVKWIHQVKK